MNILYYSWVEFTRFDAQDTLRALGHTLNIVEYDWDNMGYDEGFEAYLVGELSKKENGAPLYGCAFSFNFFPVLSIACQKCGIPYISVVFDSPHLPLTSVQMDNEVNHVYIFDRKLIALMRDHFGVPRLKYTALAVNAPRLAAQCDSLAALPYEHEVSFLGTLYDDEFDFYDQIGFLPPALKGRLDGVIEAQTNVFGYDLIGEEDVISAAMIREMHEYVNFALSDNYRMDEDLVLRDMLRRKVTKVERPRILGALARHFKVDLYTRDDQLVPEGVNDLGFANYSDQMPHIFNRSKINLNITLRTILSGIPLRALDIMGAGGFLLSTYQEELAEQFVDGEELVLAYSPRDMAEKCAYYLTHEAEREAIAAAGCRKVRAQYDYKDMLARVLRESVG